MAKRSSSCGYVAWGVFVTRIRSRVAEGTRPTHRCVRKSETREASGAVKRTSQSEGGSFRPIVTALKPFVHARAFVPRYSFNSRHIVKCAPLCAPVEPAALYKPSMHRLNLLFYWITRVRIAGGSRATCDSDIELPQTRFDGQRSPSLYTFRRVNEMVIKPLIRTL